SPLHRPPLLPSDRSAAATLDARPFAPPPWDWSVGRPGHLRADHACAIVGEPLWYRVISDVEIFAGLGKVSQRNFSGSDVPTRDVREGRRISQSQRGSKTMRKFAITTAIALLGTAMVSLPASAGPQASPSDEISAQAGTKGAGATRSGSGPGTNMGDPGIS